MNRMTPINGDTFMKPAEPVDYLAAVEHLRQEEQGQQSQIHDPDYIPPQADEPVDYLSAAKAWDRQQEGKYKIHLQTGKRNPSRDPIYREAKDESAF